MPDMKDLRDSALWSLACRLARCMFDIGSRQPFAGDTYSQEQIRGAALRLTTRVFESYENTNLHLRSAHLIAAADSVRELRHYLTLADRARDISPLVLDEARALADQLQGHLAQDSADGELAQTA